LEQIIGSIPNREFNRVFLGQLRKANGIFLDQL
jgi:hypothetical protein